MELRRIYSKDDALMSAVSSSYEDDAEDNMSSVDRVAARLDALQRAMDQYAKGVDDYCKRVTELSQGVKKFGDNIAATSIHVENQSQHFNETIDGIKRRLDEIEAQRARQVAVDSVNTAIPQGQNVYGFHYPSAHQTNQADEEPLSSLNLGCDMA